MIFALLRLFPAFWTAQQKGEWNAATRELINTGMPTIGALDDLEDKEVLILGHGSIGRALEERLRPFGAHITGVARSARPGVRSMSGRHSLAHDLQILMHRELLTHAPRPGSDNRRLLLDEAEQEDRVPAAELDDLLPEADVVVILLPITPETRHIVDVRFLARMKRGALLINAGMYAVMTTACPIETGSHVDTDALVKALHDGHIRAALDAPGVIITPHIGGAVARMRTRGYAVVMKQIKRYLAGEKLENVRLHGY
ncbi:probable glyoxylate/hydroxypyruvate reductase B at C-terminar half [Coccomyxa sp. Obi]|nr:probable glyoxylate/hydroxypyruvate reductase B at C-terminar half [Coccomyxa sp. Obi]